MSSEALVEQREMSSSSRWESYRLTNSLRRLGSFLWSTSRAKDDDDHLPAESAEREGEEEAIQKLGPPWDEFLDSFYSQNGQALGLETVVTEDEGGSFTAITWSEHNVRKLSQFFDRKKDCQEAQMDFTGFVHCALSARQFRFATMLFDHAAEQRRMHLRWSGREDILNWSINGKSKKVAEFVLQRMTERYSSPKETACCLRANFERLIQLFPETMEKYIKDDAFCFEYGKIEVNQKLFADRPDVPIAVLGEAPHSWRQLEGSNAIKDFWRRKGLGDYVELDSTSDMTITAASKFLCIDLSSAECQRDVINSLLSADFPVEVFRTQSIKELIQWRWQLRIRHHALSCILDDARSAVLFFVAAAIFGAEEDGTGAVALSFCRSLFFATLWSCCTVIIVEGSTLCSRRLLLSGILLYLLVHSCVTDHHSDTSLFLTSLQCILYMSVLIENLKPYALTGPFISMIGYVLVDIRPFIVLGMLMIITFGMAFRVLFANSLDEDDGQGFLSPWRSFESMFYATLGQFEPEVFYAPSTNLLTVWRSFLFYVFLFFASIVLLSLLIAVLGDTCDRVMLTREAELIKRRALSISRNLQRLLAPHTRIVQRWLASHKRLVFGPVGDRLIRASWLFLPVVVFLVGLGVGLEIGTVWEIAIVGAIESVTRLMTLLSLRFLARGVQLPFCKRIRFRDPLFDRLNSDGFKFVPGTFCFGDFTETEAGILVLWFLVPVTPVASSTVSFWKGRLVALSNMIFGRLKESEDRLERHISRLEASMEQQMNEMQDRLARIEGFLERTAQPSERSPYCT